MLLSKILSEENAIVSKNWFYSTELRFFNTQLVLAPLFKFLNDWKAVRVIGGIILYALMAASYGFCMRQFHLPVRYIWITAITLIFPYSFTFSHYVLTGYYYIPHIILSFLTVGLLFKYYRHSNNDLNKYIYLILYLLTCLIGGINGFRMIVISAIPILISSFFIFIREELLHQDSSYSKGIINFMHTKSCKLFLLSAAGGIAFIFGLFLNTNVFSKFFHFSSFSKTAFIKLDLETLSKKIFGCIRGLLLLFGYEEGSSLFSLQGISTALSFVALILSIMMIYHSFCVRQEPHLQFIPFITVSTALVNIFILVFIMSGETRYYIFSLLWIAPLIAFQLSNASNIFHRLTAFSLLLVLLLNSSIYYIVHKPNMSSTYPLKNVTQYLLDSDLTFGYATFWNANTFTEESNGRIEIESIDSFKTLSPYRWLMPKRYLNNDYHDGKAFILLTKGELEKANQANSAPILKKGTPAYSDSSYSVYVFDSHQTLLDHRSNLLLLCTTHGDSKLEDTAIVMKPGSFISGPYLKKMPARDYRLQVSCQLKNAADLTLKIQDNGKLIASYPLSEGTNEYPFTLEEPSASMEFIVVNSGKSEIILERMELPDYDWFNP